MGGRLSRSPRMASPVHRSPQHCPHPQPRSAFTGCKQEPDECRSKTVSLSPIRPCQNRCGFRATWHATHCCRRCEKSANTHGEKCDRLPVEEVEEEMEHEELQKPLPRDAPHREQRRLDGPVIRLLCPDERPNQAAPCNPGAEELP